MFAELLKLNKYDTSQSLFPAAFASPHKDMTHSTYMCESMYREAAQSRVVFKLKRKVIFFLDLFST